MLTPEQAREQLKAFENPNGYLEAGVRVSGLWFGTKETGLALLEGAERQHGGWTAEKSERWEKAKKDFELLGNKDRRKLLDALFPGLGEYVDAAWQRQKTGPYQTGYLRRAFRAPHAPSITANSRSEWLATLMRALLPYRADLDFCVVWAPHLRYGSEMAVGQLLAAVLDANDAHAERVFQGFTELLRGEHLIGRVARHLTTAMLSCSRPDAWEAIERLLLAAARQEGLRQVVLETIDFAHPQAFLRMLRLIEREKLSRFAAVTRAIAVWFGMLPDSSEAKWIDALIPELARDLEHANVRHERLGSNSGETVYLALWAEAFYDAEEAVRRAEPLLGHPVFEVRYTATRLLTQLGITSVRPGIKRALSDPDLRVATEAAGWLSQLNVYAKQTIPVDPELFDVVVGLVERTPTKKSLGTVLWEWNKIQADRTTLAAKLIPLRGARPWSELEQYLPLMDTNGRSSFLRALAHEIKQTGETTAEMRAIALGLIGDPGSLVRSKAFELIEKMAPSPTEAEQIEPLLARKASDLRRGVIRMLLNQSRGAAEASISRLRSAKDKLMQQAGEEMADVLAPKAAKEDQPQPLTLTKLTTPRIPRAGALDKIITGAAPRILTELDALIAEHAETQVRFKQRWGGDFDDLLGNIKYLPEIAPECSLPLQPVWRAWWEGRAKALRDDDGLELIRAAFLALLTEEQNAPAWYKKAVAEMPKAVPDRRRVDLAAAILPKKLAPNASAAVPAGRRFVAVGNGVTKWLMVVAFPQQGSGCLLDMFEAGLSSVARHYLPPPEKATGWYETRQWQGLAPFSSWSQLVELCREHTSTNWQHEDWERYWELRCWFDRGLPSKEPHHPKLEAVLASHAAGVATDADLYDQLIGGNGVKQTTRYGLHDLMRLTRRKRDPLFERYPVLDQFIEQCRRRIVDTELVRGDLPTPMSGAAVALNSIKEPGLTLQLLNALGRESFARGYNRDGSSKAGALSHLMRVSLPDEGETHEIFKQQAATLAIPDSRLIDLAIYAPQWAPFVEFATGIKGLENVAFWLHAHTKDSFWEVEEQIRELWFAEVSERTPLSRQDLLDGAVDVDWFRRMYAEVGDSVWRIVLASAKYASSAGGHKRAELFGAALLGQIGVDAILERIREKRHQDSVRALGLVPLPKAAKAARAELLSRYEALQLFIRQIRQFGSQRQASEKLAADIGLANLARTAGYPDPQRLSWAMEAETLGDLRTGALELVEDGVLVRLAIDADGEPQLTAEKNGKMLKEVPAKLRKVETVAALRTRKTQLAQQTNRMRLSLEESMVRGDIFTAAELRELSKHPLLRPMLHTLVFITEDGTLFDGTELSVAKEKARIAHAVDLLASGKWREKQSQYLGAQVRQPFKQLFRELYVITDAERRLGTRSDRYAGHQVNPAQATASVGKRGWVNVPEEGLRRTFHRDGLSAWVTFLQGWFTPTEVDGLTVEHVIFTSRADGKPIELQKLNPRLFSEAMRDLDLMVSVAHRGGVDPEASASTTEMRAALMRETATLLKLTNVRLADRHVFIKGTLGDYNVHLGSGTVHRQPGGSLCIVPVGSQQRGRIFLPFADDDPKTAEIVSKVLLLADDKAIQDPTILEQIS